MRDLPSALQAHLDTGATTICTCWRLIRRDGVVLGFTDHDRDLHFDGVAFLADSGFEGSQTQSQIGMAVGGGDVAGVLAASSLTEGDLLNGLYDDARVEIWRVNWQAPEQRVLLDVATLGEISRTPGAFTAELRGLAHLLDQDRGRLFQSACYADLGDHRCGVDLSAPQWRAQALVAQALDEMSFRVGVTGFATHWFSNGQVEFLDGANAGARQTVESFRVDAGGALVRVWSAPAHPVAPGDAVELTAGCDKTFDMCRNRFANAINFRGFPHMPGNEAFLKHPGSSDGPMDGGSMHR